MLPITGGVNEYLYEIAAGNSRKYYVRGWNTSEKIKR